MFDARMLPTLRQEAAALARMPEHQDARRTWSINAFAGTIRDMRDGSLVLFFHPAALDPLPGFWFFPHDRGSS